MIAVQQAVALELAGAVLMAFYFTVGCLQVWRDLKNRRCPKCLSTNTSEYPAAADYLRFSERRCQSCRHVFLVRR